jgi:membrane protein implicated in regulation of membrane protease activity
MEVLPYFVVGGAVVASIVIGIVLGDWFWMLTVVALIVGVIYVVGDRRLRREESPPEREAADPTPE